MLRPHGRPWGRCTEADIDRTFHSVTGPPRGWAVCRRLLVALGWLLLLAGQPAIAADRTSGTAYLYPGASAQPGDLHGRQPGFSGGSYRPTDPPTGQWQGQQGRGSGATGMPSVWGQGGATPWNGQPPSYEAEPWSGQPGRTTSDYRFRPRPEDKAAKGDASPRYRPDPELARRSQQFWGIPGEDWSSGGASGAVFRPLRPEEQQTDRSATAEQYPGLPVTPTWSGMPASPVPGYGYPY